MVEVLKFVTFGRGSQKKNAKKFLLFLQKYSILRPFSFKFRFERPVLSSAKRAQNKHKNHWTAQTKLLNVFANDIMRSKKMKLQFFWYL